MLRGLGLAMDLDDLLFCQRYFRDEEGRDPTLTEIRMIDTYWSDHCRHTTFLTSIEEADIQPAYIRASYEKYISWRDKLGISAKKPVTLMDLGTIGAKILRSQGLLKELDESEEINACSVKIPVDVDGVTEEWLLLFKNETHNHPTEIEPFGGAATCLGGAIRDPLSGRSYVYQAMRVTGAGNPLESAGNTLPGKLPQRKICQTAAAGYSSYGNQVGIATGHVHEIYHPGYTAKRMEIGAVAGAVPARHVRRQRPQPGDLVILLGGRTGRDGCGGATGSSKSHSQQSLETCGAEVQKGNAPEERKIQRLFRNPDVTALIKRCNDFGAGGVSVAIGELADGLRINLDAVPKKYDGLSGTELAISESQERMAVVVERGDRDRFIALADEENLEATVVAVVTEQPRLVMDWNGGEIVSLSRTFLNSNGAPKSTRVRIPAPPPLDEPEKPLTGQALAAMMGSLEYCSQKGLVERFDSTIGAATVLMPFGGSRQLTPCQSMAALLPVPGGKTTTCSLMAWGFDPHLSQRSPYHGGMCAVVHSVAKIVASGGTRSRCWLTFQEYFERTRNDPARWGKPAAALLGALEAQLELQCAAIGGKDSMSGSFEDIDVPPTLVSFAVSVQDAGQVISPEFKAAGSPVYHIAPRVRGDGTTDFADLRRVLDQVEALIAAGRVCAAWAVGSGGTAEAVAKMSFGNGIGFAGAAPLGTAPGFGGFVLEAARELPELAERLLGRTTAAYTLCCGDEVIDLGAVQAAWEGTLAPVFPYRDLPGTDPAPIKPLAWSAQTRAAPALRHQKPRVVIPVFPGTNCEYDTAAAFARAGADPEIFVLRNLTASAINQSVEEMAKRIDSAQIIALPGGFSGGDEPEGSGKFITAFFRNPRISQAVHELLDKRDGLMCGICNGFQALVKLGLVPYGEIRQMDAHCPTLTYNTIGRHQSTLVRIRVASNKSPWLMHAAPGDIYTAPVSHGEGRFIAGGELLEALAANGQLATQYVDPDGVPTLDLRYNPNSSLWAVEGVTSPDGRVFGKMAHDERRGEALYRNVPVAGEALNIFRGAVDYYRQY